VRSAQRQLNPNMTQLEAPYQVLLRTLGKTEKGLLEKRLETEELISRQIIETNIRSDKEHLTIVNFVVSRFIGGSHVNAETGYAWVRVEPLFGIPVKRFDIAIYNNQSKVMVLVECKSGLSDPNREIQEIQEKIQGAVDNRALLSEMVGDDIVITEFALCLKAGLIPAAKAAISSSSVPCCIWGADIFAPTLFLDQQGQDMKTEIRSGRSHHEEKLRKMLLEGIRDSGSARVITFLPTSHMCSILEEIVPLLRLELDRVQSEVGEFNVTDIETLTKREISLQNFSDDERKLLTERILKTGVEAGIFIDLTPDLSDLWHKKLKLASQAKSTRHVVKDCHEKYVRHNSKEMALRKLLAETDNKQPGLEKYAVLTKSKD